MTPGTPSNGLNSPGNEVKPCITATHPPDKWPGTSLFNPAEPSFTPIVINGARAQAVVFGNTGDALENDAGRFHFHYLPSSFVYYLVHAFKNAKSPAAIADHL
jgi:hypothetical protein